MLLNILQNRENMDQTDLLVYFIAYAILVFLILPFHEFAHAYVAHKCGDDTAKWNGRLTLNPLRHLDPFGTLMLVFCGIGYAKPVPVISRNLHNYRRDMILIALAGPVSNLLMAFAAAGIFKVCTLFITDAVVLSWLYIILIGVIMSVNISLAVFNLLPIPPLDGSRLWSTLLPGKWAFKLEQNSRYITIGLFVLLMTGILDRPLSFINGLFQMLIFGIFGL